MNDAFLPGNGFDTYEEQDRVLMGLSGSVRSGVAVRILQQQGFAVAAAVVRLADTPEEHAAVDAAKALAKKLDVECVTLNAEALAGQDAEAARFDLYLEYVLHCDCGHSQQGCDKRAGSLCLCVLQLQI